MVTDLYVSHSGSYQKRDIKSEVRQPDREWGICSYQCNYVVGVTWFIWLAPQNWAKLPFLATFVRCVEPSDFTLHFLHRMLSYTSIHLSIPPPPIWKLINQPPLILLLTINNPESRDFIHQALNSQPHLLLASLWHEVHKTKCCYCYFFPANISLLYIYISRQINQPYCLLK